eukprot:688935-Pelagomonas_calceolata.AAC.4
MSGVSGKLPSLEPGSSPLFSLPIFIPVLEIHRGVIAQTMTAAAGWAYGRKGDALCAVQAAGQPAHCIKHTAGVRLRCSRQPAGMCR